MRLIIFIAVIFLFSYDLFSQNDTVYFRHYNLENGLSNRNVTSVIQDSLGFMWYGTHEGINKFDGYKFIPFKHDPKNPNSLVSDDVSCLAVEKNGMFKTYGIFAKKVGRAKIDRGNFRFFKSPFCARKKKEQQININQVADGYDRATS